MSENPQRKMAASPGGFVNDLSNRVKLIVRLMADKRVNPLLKLLPIGAVIYLFFPDILIGPFDDAAVLWLGSSLFVELCPPHIVEEHRAEISRITPGNWHDPLDEEGEVIDGEWQDKTSS